MFIKSLSLKNIRSYELVKLDFSEGSTVLSGDIGSGKTTVLMALEFALFGILRGKVSPTELLRHGSDEGYVSLSCTIQDKEVFIKRGLKRSSSNVVQTPGTLIIDGLSQELAPTDLKAKVLVLLGYPSSLIAKSTNLFRYTVYTPQEQVKLILFETPESRKDIIRNIFSIDSYKRVADNSNLYSTDLRERISFMKGSVDDIKILNEQLSAQKRELDMLILKIPEKELLFKKNNELVKLKEEELSKIDKKRLEKLSKEKEVVFFEEKLKGIKNMISSFETQKNNLAKELADFQIKKIDFDSSKKDKFKEVLNQIHEKRTLMHNRFGTINAKREQANSLVSSVSSLTFCPTCKQDVSNDHKHKIKDDQDKILEELTLSEDKLKELQTALLAKEKDVLEKQEIYLNLEKEYLLSKSKVEQKERLSKDLVRFEKEITTQNDLLKETSNKLVASKKEFDLLPNVDSSKERTELEALRLIERKSEIELTEFKTKVEVSKRQISLLEEAIKKKNEISKQIENLSLIKTWNSELFIPLVKDIEKKVLLKVYNEFNLYFQKWFDLLLEDETISVKLNEDFTPLVEQNGFDTSISNLSGGEKTSVALAYRLSLNKVLNDYFGTIHTKGLLILDEPTDGFSSQQLDKLRDVLDELGISQVIIVSHEAKLDSLAKNHIRIEKIEQISKIVSSNN